jgi:hypothetical protein
MTPNTIQFYSDSHTEVLRLSKEGIWANPDIPADEAAKLVLEAIDHNIKVLVEKAVSKEREACAKVCDDLPAPDSCSGSEGSLWDVATLECGDAIRARSKDEK